MYRFGKYRLWFGYFLSLSLLNICLVLANISTAFAEENIEYRFERLWPRLEQPWYFQNPSDLAIALDGSVYVVDSGNNRIQQFSAQGGFILSWGNEGSGDGQFNQPQGISIAPDGSVYVSDTKNNRIQKFDPQGKFLQTWGNEGTVEGQFNSPIGIAVTSDGSVYVADSGNNRIQQFNAQGDFIQAWGNKGSAESQFNSPAGLAIASDGSIYVADDGNNRIQQFSPQGDFVRAWGNEGTADAQFNSPKGLSIASDGSVYVTDTLNHRIQQFSTQGDFIRTWGSKGSDDEQFKFPTGIAIASDDSIYISEVDIDSQIKHFGAQGNFIQIWKSRGLADGRFNRPHDIAITSDGSVYVTDKWNHRVQQFSTQGVFIRTWGSGRSWGDDGILDDGLLSYPTAIVAAPDDSVYIADSGSQRIQQFNAEGQFIRTWGNKGSAEGQFDSPVGIAIALDGSVYVADRYNHRIQQFSAEGIFIRTWGMRGSDDGQFKSPEGLTIASDGNVYVADSENNRIQQFSPQGEFIKTWGTKGSSDGQFESPAGIAIASDDSIYVTDKNHIQQFNAQGDFIRAWENKGSGKGQFNFLNGIGVAISSDDKIYIADTANNRIQKFSPNLKSTTASSYKAIILAGGGEKFGSGRTNSIWNGTWHLAQKAYEALTNQAFKIHEEIKFLTAGNTQIDLDQNDKFDDLEAATKESLRTAITEWASDATDVVIYLSNHGGPGKFKVNGTETLTSEELNDWVSQLEEKIPGKITLVIEACNSASFFTHLSKPGRFLLASAKADQNAVISNDGFSSFSYIFWSEIAAGTEVKTAFENARQFMSKIIIENEAQSAQAETDGNNVFNQQDLDQLGDYCFGECNKTAGAAPEIKPFSPASQTLNDSTLDFSVKVDSLQPINTVWAIVQRPDDISIDTNQPLNFEKIDLSCDKEKLCKGQYTRFDLKGEYRLSVYALDTQGDISFPETLIITQPQGKDVYPVQYDENLETVYLRDVEYQGQHYQVALESKDNRFVMIAASPAPQIFSPAAQFDDASDLLIIPHALAFGKPYEARFKHLGNFEFELESATPK